MKPVSCEPEPVEQSRRTPRRTPPDARPAGRAPRAESSPRSRRGARRGCTGASRSGRSGRASPRSLRAGPRAGRASDRRSARSTAADRRAECAWSRATPRSIMRASSADNRCGSATAPHRSARRAVGLRASGAPTRRRALTTGSLSGTGGRRHGRGPGGEAGGGGEHEAADQVGAQDRELERDRAAQRVAEQVERLARAGRPAASREHRGGGFEVEPLGRRARLAEPREVGSEHVMVRGQRRGHAAPDGAARADSVQEHERLAVPGLVDRDHRGGCTLHR